MIIIVIINNDNNRPNYIHPYHIPFFSATASLDFQKLLSCMALRGTQTSLGNDVDISGRNVF
jgi:hypothetical protein